MQIILLENVFNLGGLGDTVKVRSGYARNFLIPQGKAVPATAENVAEFEARRAELERQQAEAIAAAQARADALADVVITVTRKAGEEGKLFGSVGTGDVADALAAAGHDVKRQEVRMPGEAIRQTGAYEIALAFPPGVEATITLQIEPEG